MASTDQDDHDQVPADSDFDASPSVNLVLPLAKVLALKLYLGLGTSQGKVAFADPLCRGRRNMVPATKAHLAAHSNEFIPISFNVPVFGQNSEGSPDLRITELRTRKVYPHRGSLLARAVERDRLAGVVIVGLAAVPQTFHIPGR